MILTKILKKARGPAGVLALIIYTLLLSACGYNSTGATQTALANTVTPAVQLPPITVTVNQPSPTTEVTSTPNVVSNITPAPSAAVIQNTATPTKAAPTLTPTSGPTQTPTPSGTLTTIDKEAELKVVKNAYDAIVKNLFKQPDTATYLKAGLQELGQTTGITPPEVQFGDDTNNNWNLFKDAFNQTVGKAVANGFKYPKSQLADRIVNAMADAVNDEHTYFLDASGYDARQRLLQGENFSVGFGILIISQNDKIYVTRVVPNSPADKAGMKAGDQLVKYDDIELNDKTRNVIRQAKENESHSFVISRPGQADPLTIQVTKQRYSLPTVEYRMINGHIGYIAIREFFTNVAEETNKAMVALKNQGADSWIIDVRDNPGGVDVEQTVGRFVQGGEVMGYNINRKSREPLKITNDGVTGEFKGKPFTPLLPLVILINEGSASSSEILALAVRDFQLGPVIGVKSAGALGHTAAFALGDGTAISVTLDEYESKSGIRDNGIGVTPDIIVERSINDLVTGRDPQLQSGIEQLEKTLAHK
jgi:carboxyl-terminal processing protease